MNMAEHIRSKSINNPFYRNQLKFCVPIITIRRISGKGGYTYNVQNSQPMQNINDNFSKAQFLSQLGLVDIKTAQLKIEESEKATALNRKRRDALVKKMLRMKPKYYLENGKVKRIQYTPKAKKKIVQKRLQKKVSRKRPASESCGVYFSMPKKVDSYKAANKSRLRSHLARKATTGLGLSKRSKKLLDVCPDLCIKVRRMSDSEISRKIKKTETAGKTLQSTKCVNTIIHSENKLGLSERSQKLLASCREFSVRVQRMSDSNVAQKIRETQALQLQKQDLYMETTANLNSITSFADQAKNYKASFTSVESRPHEKDLSVDVYRMTEGDIQNNSKNGKQLATKKLMDC